MNRMFQVVMSVSGVSRLATEEEIFGLIPADCRSSIEFFLANAKVGDVYRHDDDFDNHIICLGRVFRKKFPGFEEILDVSSKAKCTTTMAREALIESACDVEGAVVWLRNQGLA